ncbi:H-NS histone family protein [Pseudogemmobacter bohemicus]|uniref:H-NS histone family protein n=1 Tax=Pseudogemmobacter bohemicus TaxID=2250708 RepID=UPI000DD3224D|nr:H-NS histone family protein [Pseudogemmobacter bohemicus]
MAKITKEDLQGYSIADLDALAVLVAEVKRENQAVARQAAKDKIEAFAREAGLTVRDLFGFGGGDAPKVKATRAKGDIAPKYAHPENPSITWSGRGRQPVWFKEWVDGGKSGDDLLIK